MIEHQSRFYDNTESLQARMVVFAYKGPLSATDSSIRPSSRPNWNLHDFL